MLQFIEGIPYLYYQGQSNQNRNVPKLNISTILL